MTSRRRITPNQTVSLFPFLAVLICTMGALLVLLVVMARQARVRAAEEVANACHDEPSNPTPEDPSGNPDMAAGSSSRDTPNDALPDDPGKELADLTRRAKALEVIHREGRSQLQTSQLQLGHIEDQIRRLHDRWATIHQKAVTIQELDETYLADREKAEQELEHLQDLVRESQAEVAEARLEASRKTKSYAIVPYEGANSTHRRPLYIECRKSSVVLLPEGIALQPNDFSGPLGPGNPLAAALRAAHEYYTSQVEDPLAPDQQPYPLLLVRPEGIPAYYQAREALASWSIDFGYELIDGDWPLELPPANPELAELEYRAVEAARFRQRQLARAAPRQFGAGFQRNPGARFGIGSWPARDGLAAGQEHGSVTTRQGNTVSESARTAAKPASDQSNHAVSGDARGGDDPGSPQNSPGGESGQLGHGPGLTPGAGAIHGMASSGTCQAPATAGGCDPTPNRATGQSALGGPKGLASGTEVGTAEFGAPGSAHSNPQNGSRRLGGTANEHPRDAVPIRRAIHVHVNGSQLAILPEQGADGGHVVPVTGSVDGALNEFVSALQVRMRSWGIAGRGLFWKPILVLKPSPDGTAHAERLAQRLRRSGVEVQMPGSTRR